MAAVTAACRGASAGRGLSRQIIRSGDGHAAQQHMGWPVASWLRAGCKSAGLVLGSQH